MTPGAAGRILLHDMLAARHHDTIRVILMYHEGQQPIVAQQAAAHRRVSGLQVTVHSGT